MKSESPGFSSLTKWAGALPSVAYAGIIKSWFTIVSLLSDQPLSSGDGSGGGREDLAWV